MFTLFVRFGVGFRVGFRGGLEGVGSSYYEGNSLIFLLFKRVVTTEEGAGHLEGNLEGNVSAI